MNNQRIDAIVEACDTYNSTRRKRLVAGKLYDYFMQDFKGELAVIYQGATKEDIREDIKILADLIYSAENKAKREFYVGALRYIVKLM